MTLLGRVYCNSITVPKMGNGIIHPPQTTRGGKKMNILNCEILHLITLLASLTLANSIRIPDYHNNPSNDPSHLTIIPSKTAVFCLGSFWRSEPTFGCLEGVLRTTVGYAAGSKPNPEYRSLGDHAECVQIEYDPRKISFRQLLEVFWASHDPRQVFGQGPDVGSQYRSIIFTNEPEESRLAAVSKESEQNRLKGNVVTTQILSLGTFHPAEAEHQKFELKRNPFLLQLIGNLPEDELEKSSLAAKMNGYAAELCPPRIQRHIDAKVSRILKKGWPIFRDV